MENNILMLGELKCIKINVGSKLSSRFTFVVAQEVGIEFVWRGSRQAPTAGGAGAGGHWVVIISWYH